MEDTEGETQSQWRVNRAVAVAAVAVEDAAADADVEHPPVEEVVGERSL